MGSWRTKHSFVNGGIDIAVRILERRCEMKNRIYKAPYSGEALSRIAYPLGGTGAGMICMQGTGAIGSVSVRNKMDIHNEPNIFAAVTVKKNQGTENISAVLEGPVPKVKIFEAQTHGGSAGNGLHGKNYGLPRFEDCTFESSFPVATIKLKDKDIPLSVQIKAYSPFMPGDDFNSCLPGATLEYLLTNTSDESLEAVYYFASFNFMREGDGACVRSMLKDRPQMKGFILSQPPLNEKHKLGDFCAFVEDDAYVDAAWFRGGWFDTFTMLWKDIQKGIYANKSRVDGDSAGATLAIPFYLKPGESKVIRLHLCWYVPYSDIRVGTLKETDGCCCGGSCSAQQENKPTYEPWYATVFPNIEAVCEYFATNSAMLKERTMRFSDAIGKITLPDAVVDAVDANLAIIKSSTILREKGGRMWGWEGCHDCAGCCEGTCTHVWNYAQSIPHLLPTLERSLRRTEFNECQDERGHQQFRAPLPIAPSAHGFHAAADGQLGGIMKVYRDYLIYGDKAWLEELWPKVKMSLDYCINTWDKLGEGILREPHHNTYDIEFWGPDGMCGSFYLGALKAAMLMAEIMGDNAGKRYGALYLKGRKYLEEKLFNGEYFYHEVMRDGLEATLKPENEHPETAELLAAEGPKYQYGTGCLSDGVLGAWMAEVCGVGEILDRDKVKSHLLSIFKYNYKPSLKLHSNPQRPGYAVGDEGGLLLCSWPRGGKPSLPFVYSDEVWTGIEYHVAAHLIMHGCVDEGLQIVKTCRDRYDGIVRNPYNEYECGNWYARAMSSYSLLYALSGISYDATRSVLTVAPVINDDFVSLLSTATGYALVGVRDGEAFIEVVEGDIKISGIEHRRA